MRILIRTGQWSRIALVMACAVAPTNVQAQEAALSQVEHIRQGNVLIEDGRFVEALAEYDKAVAASPDSLEAAYNRGLALYRLNRYAEAGKAFQDALKPGRPDLEARVKFNLGRCAHQAALSQREKLDEAMNEAIKAVNFYKEVVRLAPKDTDAARNLAEAEHLAAYLEKKLKEQQEQQQDSPSSQPTSKPQDEPTSQPDEKQPPNSQPSSQPDSSEQQQQKQDSPQGEKEDKGEQSQQNDQQQSQESEQTKKSEQQKGQSGESGDEDQQSSESSEEDESQAKELKQEQVEPMLQEARDQERQRREAKRARMLRMRGRTPVKKDW